MFRILNVNEEVTGQNFYWIRYEKDRKLQSGL